MVKKAPETINVFVNGHPLAVEPGTTVLQASQMLDIEVPIFCYHPRLSVAGNCRMCLVEIEGQKKPVASCAMPVAEGMRIRTDTKFVRESREGALEFLLLHHPLDCPICDQGGECDLQDVTVSYGRDKSRFAFYKRAVQKKEFGPLIKTEMNRCIHCTRCVRFATEVAGLPEVGAVNRGEHTEIVSLMDKPFASELSGNVIDLCPVGALTSKPYAFKGRSWEMRRTESIDVMDAVGSHIRIDTRGGEVMRILPRVFQPVNEEWISDKARFAYDGLKMSRLDRPYVKDEKGILREASWYDALESVSKQLKLAKADQIAALAGDMVDIEAFYCMNKLLDHLKSPHRDCRQDGAFLMSGTRSSYIMNTPIDRVEEADFALLIGTNIRTEAPIVNARLRKAYAHGILKAAYVGPEIDLGYPATCLGDDPSVLKAIADGKHPIAEKLKAAKKPILFLGQAPLRRKDAEKIMALAHTIADKYGLDQKDWCGFNVLQNAAARVGGMDVGFVPKEGGKNTEQILEAARKGQIKVLYLMGADEIDTAGLEKTFVIYQGHHGDKGAEVADVILPSAAYTEKEGLYVNAEGRPQSTYRACPAPGEAKPDWNIIQDLAKKMGLDLGYAHVADLRQDIEKQCPLFGAIGQRPNKPFTPFLDKLDAKASLTKAPVRYAFENFYKTDVISRHSEVMDQCTRAFMDEKEGGAGK